MHFCHTGAGSPGSHLDMMGRHGPWRTCFGAYAHNDPCLTFLHLFPRSRVVPGPCCQVRLSQAAPSSPCCLLLKVARQSLKLATASPASPAPLQSCFLEWTQGVY